MAGALQYIAAGMGEGLGRGMVAIGNSMAAEEEQRRREEAMMERERLRAENDERMLQQRLEAQQQGGGRGGRGGGALSMLDVAKLPDDQVAKAMSLAGMDPTRARDAVAMAGGQPVEVEQELDPNRFANPDRIADAQAAGPQRVKVAKYDQGQGAALMQEAAVSLRRAMGLPENAKTIAEAEGQEQVNSLVGKFAKGDDRAGDAALIGQGKDPNAAEVRADATVEAARVRAAAAGKGGAGKGGNPGGTVQSTFVNARGERVAIMRDGSQRVIGPDAQVQKIIQSEKQRLSKTLDNIGASDADLESRAVDNLLSRSEGAGVKPSGGSGGQPSGAAPYKEGQRLRGPDGKVYVVRNGKPVLEGR